MEERELFLSMNVEPFILHKAIERSVRAGYLRRVEGEIELTLQGLSRARRLDGEPHPFVP